MDFKDVAGRTHVQMHALCSLALAQGQTLDTRSRTGSPGAQCSTILQAKQANKPHTNLM